MPLAPGAGAQTIRGTLMEFGSDSPIDLGLIIMVSEFGDSVTFTMNAGAPTTWPPSSNSCQTASAQPSNAQL